MKKEIKRVLMKLAGEALNFANISRNRLSMANGLSQRTDIR